MAQERTMAAPPISRNADARDTSQGAEQAPPRRHGPEMLTGVRASDIEPYTGLRYLSKLFRMLAIGIVLFWVAEVVLGFVSQGAAALPTLLAESVKLIVSAALLWASGDLAILLIDVGHDVRATRIFLARQAAHQLAQHHAAEGADAAHRTGDASRDAGAPAPGAS